jgi:[protein-PII] uridylyltransferase
MRGAKQGLFDAGRFDADLAISDSPLPLFRAALQHGRHELRELYNTNPRAGDLIRLHAWLVDQLLLRIWKQYVPLLPKGVNVGLIAVGGYGRSELHPASDIDIMLLLEHEDHDRIRPFVEGLVHFLWDMGLEIGHSVRSLDECVREARKDITVSTNLMESRLLQGDSALFLRMRALTGPPEVWPSKAFFGAKLREQIERHHRFHDTAYNLEPNIKEGPGGLRDIQMIGWVTQRHFGTNSLHDLVKLQFLSEQEFRTLMRGRNFLWQLRTGLHHLAGRREDRLLFDYQRALAGRLGYKDKRGSLAVEQLMKRYYRTVKELRLLNDILLQHFNEAILTSGKSKILPINRRFQSRDGFIETVHNKIFERSPFAILEIFLLMQQHADLKGVRASTIRLLRANLHRIDDTFRRDIACRSLFMEILRQSRGITHELRRMNAYGVLGAYVPAFGRIVGQMQHDLFHVYTVDEHCLFVVRNVRRFTVPEFRHEFPLASEIVQHVVKPERLYLAGLFHDIAKGRGGDHSTLGEKEARAFCQLHGLSEYDTRLVSWLVRHHLLMSWTAQREDVSDPEVVLRFAEKVGDQEHLDNLYLLTVADMRGTSPNVWNAWKGRLLSQLYAETSRMLRRGFATPLDIDARIADLRAEALALLRTRGVPEESVQAHWARMDKDYFLRHDAESLAWHAQMIAGLRDEDLPLVAARYRPEHGGTEFLIFAPDRDDLFAVITGGFDRLNLSIVEARIHTTRSGFALDTFVALDHAGVPVVEPVALAQLRQALRAQLLAPRPGHAPGATHLSRRLKHFPIGTKVGFSPAPRGTSTVMEVIAQDRPGLLYQVALALQHCGIRLLNAKVATYGERAEDIFFVSDPEGQPLSDAAQMVCAEREIVRRLGITAPETVPREIPL